MDTPTRMSKFSSKLIIVVLGCCAALAGTNCFAQNQIIVPGQVVLEGLKDHVPRGFYIGGALHGDSSFKDVGYRQTAERNFNAVTATVYLPWTTWEKRNQGPNFAHFNAVVDWATQRNMKVHGHTLLFPWANEQSQWWKGLPLSFTQQHLKEYVTRLVTTRRGKIWTWDVVNEVMANDNERMDGDGLRVGYKEYKAMGPGYIDKMFHWAAQGDPNAKLIFNTTGCEQINNKSNRLLAYVKKLKARGVPIHGIGFQSHFVDTNSADPGIENIRKNFQRFANAGFEIYMTEVDVCAIKTRLPSAKTPGVTTPNDAQLGRQRRFFEQTLQLALTMPEIKSYLLWDYADDFSWLHKTNSQVGNVPKDTYTYPTPFWGGKACAIIPKPSYDGLMNVLKTTVKIDR